MSLRRPSKNWGYCAWTMLVRSPPSSTISVGPLPSGPPRAPRSCTTSVLFERLALPREYRRAARVGRAARFRTTDGDRGRGVILSREDVAAHPAHVGAEFGERLDQHGGLNRHVQAAHDARALQRLLAGVMRAKRHQPGHFVLGETNLVAAEFGERQNIVTLNGSRPAALAAANGWIFVWPCCCLVLSVTADVPVRRVGGPRAALFASLCPVATNNAGPLTLESGAAVQQSDRPNPASPQAIVMRSENPSHTCPIW